MYPRHFTMLFVFTTCAFLLGGSAARAEMACDLASRAAASLLLPYFEVDVESENGKSTLFAVGNTAETAVLARVVLWTNWGNPVAAFDFGLEGQAVRTFNLRDVLAGRLPETQPPPVQAGRHVSCSNPVVMPALDPAALLKLLTGQPNPVDGLCYGTAVEEGQLATGYVTVDVVNDCSGTSGRTPLDVGYFGDCASGLASNDNVLWGDFFFIDPSSDHAKGERMVALHTDQTRFGTFDACVDPPCGSRNSISFYEPTGNRMPLPAAYQTRFLQGGGFDGGTELLVWVHGRIPPAACANVPRGRPIVRLEAQSERGVALGIGDLSVTHASRVRLSDANLPLGNGFGRVEVTATNSDGQAQLWVMPLLAAQGRYSVGFTAVPVRDFCE